MKKIAIIGGTGLTSLDGFVIDKQITVDTPYGKPSAPLTLGSLKNRSIYFLPRHGSEHGIPPHLINYRANIWALKNAGMDTVIAIAAVGGISKNMKPASVIIPDQIIDYTYGREHTFFDQHFQPDQHIDFTEPYDQTVRKLLINAASKNKISIIDKAVYGAAQGPRLETAAEIRRMEKDGCDLVGMTAMPEAALAKELQLPYACCAVVVNWAAGKSKEEITMEIIKEYMNQGMEKAYQILETVTDQSKK